MSRVLVVGVDGMEPRLVEQWMHKLPNLARMSREGVLGPIASVFPHDSLPAWTTIYTGRTPGEHGLFDTIDYLADQGKDSANAARFAGQTFWDEAGRRGRRVCVVNAFMAYPVWPVNGVMASGPVFVTGQAQSYPPGILQQHPHAELGGVVDYPYRWDLARFAQRAATAVRGQAALAKSLMRAEPWDLCFVCLLTLDRVQHFFWRFHDPTDPAHPGRNRFERTILDHYRLIDGIVGELMGQAGDATTIVLSDHGHGQRPSRLFEVNEWLRRQGWLEPAGASAGKAKLIERAKSLAFAAAIRLRAEDVLYAAARVIPKQHRASLKDSSFAVDRAASRAYAGKLGGSTGCGGIVLAERGRALADEISHALMEVTDPTTGQRVVEWVRPRDAVVRGPFAGSAPHLLFQLAPGYGAGRTVFGPLFSASPTHRRISGGHTAEGVFAALRALGGRAPQRLDQVHAAILRALDA